MSEAEANRGPDLGRASASGATAGAASAPKSGPESGRPPEAVSGGEPEPREGRRRRRFDPGSVVTGLFFLGVAAVFLVAGLSGTPVVETRVLAPALLAGLGLVGIVRVLTRSRRH